MEKKIGNRIQLLVPREKGLGGYYQLLLGEDSESVRSEYLSKAKEIVGSVVLVDLNHCTVRVIYENK